MMGPIESELAEFWNRAQERAKRNGVDPYFNAAQLITGLSSDAAAGVFIEAERLSTDEPERPTSRLFWYDAFSAAQEAASILKI